jgi:hypothetical protein
MEITMNRKRMLVAITAVALGIAGAVSSAQAGNDHDEERGGIKIGPLGQRFAGPPTGRAFAFAPLTTRHGRVYRHHRYYYYY